MQKTFFTAGKRFMLFGNEKERSLSLVEFDRESAMPTAGVAIASLDEGKPVIPVCLDVIYQQFNNRLNGRNEYV